MDKKKLRIEWLQNQTCTDPLCGGSRSAIKCYGRCNKFNTISSYLYYEYDNDYIRLQEINNIYNSLKNYYYSNNIIIKKSSIYTKLHKSIFNILNDHIDIDKLDKIINMYNKFRCINNFTKNIFFIQLNNYNIKENFKKNISNENIWKDFINYIECYNLYLTKGLVIKEYNENTTHIVLFIDFTKNKFNYIYDLIKFEKELLKYIENIFINNKKNTKYTSSKYLSQIIFYNNKIIQTLLKKLRPFYDYIYEVYVNNNYYKILENPPEIIEF